MNSCFPSLAPISPGTKRHPSQGQNHFSLCLVWDCPPHIFLTFTVHVQLPKWKCCIRSPEYQGGVGLLPGNSASIGVIRPAAPNEELTLQILVTTAHMPLLPANPMHNKDPSTQGCFSWHTSGTTTSCPCCLIPLLSHPPHSGSRGIGQRDGTMVILFLLSNWC